MLYHLQIVWKYCGLSIFSVLQKEYSMYNTDPDNAALWDTCLSINKFNKLAILYHLQMEILCGRQYLPQCIICMYNTGPTTLLCAMPALQ